MKQFLFYTITSILIIIAVFFVFQKLEHYNKQKPILKPDVLRSQIISTLKNPFPQADTFILEYLWYFCGNSTPEEIPIVFETQLEKEENKRLLSSLLKMPVITIAEFQKVMDSIRIHKFNGKYPPSLWDTCRIGKVSAEILAEQLSSKKVRLYENYLYNETATFIRKDFIFKNGFWTYKIIDFETKILTQ